MGSEKSKQRKAQISERVCFDIETHPFSEEFLSANTTDKIKFAPEPRIVCVFMESSKQYKFFEPSIEGMRQLAAILNNSAEVISYNGEQFDFLVLERHYPELFTGTVERIKSVDMMLVAQRETGCNFYFSLNKMAKVNFGQGKMVAGREMNSIDLEKIKAACKSDVSQTYALWKLWKSGKIKYPPHKKHLRTGDLISSNDDWISIQVSPPELCPSCGDVNSVEIIEEDPEDLDEITEGQWADYQAGWNRSAVCTTCGMMVFLG